MSSRAEPRVYNSRWAKAARTFLAGHPLCAMCQAQGRAVAATVVDHIREHRLKQALRSGDKAAIAQAQRLFWDKSNWQGLCKSHHDSTKQRIEKRGVEIGCDVDGLPIDARHHWHGLAMAFGVADDAPEFVDIDDFLNQPLSM